LNLPGKPLQASNIFEIKRKANRLGLKSTKYSGKFVAKAMMTSNFTFHTLQIFGPHESYEVCGEFLKVLGNVSKQFLECSSGRYIHHHGGWKKKSRIVIVSADDRKFLLANNNEEEDESHNLSDSIIIEAKTPKIFSTSLIQEIKPFTKETPKSNSTGTLFIKDTIALPDLDELNNCMALYLHKLIENGNKVSHKKTIEIFDETIYPITSATKEEILAVPSEESIFHFVNTIFKVQKLPAEPGVMAFMYMNRLIEKTGLTLEPSNWKRVILSCLLLSSKVWEDAAVWNIDFLDVFPTMTVKDLNRTEQKLLTFLEFNVSMKSSEYVRVYFDLRAIGGRHDERSFSEKPLDAEGEDKLELKTKKKTKAFKKENQITKSFGDLTLSPQYRPLESSWPNNNSDKQSKKSDEKKSNPETPIEKIKFI